MKRIEIENFVTIKKAIYEPKKFNIVIGPQSTGKSLLVKLDYFFSSFLTRLSSFYAISNVDINYEPKKVIKEYFYEFFNKNIISNYDFKIIFKSKNIELKIFKNKENTVEVVYNINLEKLIDEVKEEAIKYRENRDAFIDNTVLNFENKSQLNDIFKSSYFIPAGRTYFSTLKESIFTLLQSGYRVDSLLLNFGRIYEIATNDLNRFNNKKMLEKASKILRGNIVYKKEINSVGIQNDNIFTPMEYLSSGQQEVLPLIVVLLYLEILKANLFIEEPEAHLYPVSQKELVELIAYIYNKGSDINITTHSPYIITAINNLLLLDEKKDKIDKNSPFYEMLDYKISGNDISAYTIEDGILKNIYDKENNLIDAYSIDSVSEELSQEFNELLELE